MGRGIGFSSAYNRHLGQVGKDQKRRLRDQQITYFAGESTSSPIDPEARRFEMMYNRIMHLLCGRGVREANVRMWVDETYFPEGRNPVAYKIAADALAIRVVEIERDSRMAQGLGFKAQPRYFQSIYPHKALVPTGICNPHYELEAVAHFSNRVRSHEVIYLMAVVA
jgi:hypothetical protein